MSLHRSVFASMIGIALLSTSVLAAWSAGPGERPAGGAFVGDNILIGGKFRVEIDTELVSLSLQSDVEVRAPIQMGQTTRVPASFQVQVDLYDKKKNNTGGGGYFVQSFFDVFFDALPSDPTLGQVGFVTASLSGMADAGSLQTAAGVIRPCGIFEMRFDLRDDVASGQTMFQSRSFHHLLLAGADLAGAPFFDYGAMTDEGTTFATTKAGTDAQVDSFFDVFFDVFTDPDTRGGGGMAQSFFDISYVVFEPNDEPLLEVSADGHVKVGARLRPGPGDAMVQILNRQSERIDVMFNPKEYSVGKSNQWIGNEALAAGSSAMVVDSFFDVFFKVQPQPEPPRIFSPVRKEIDLSVQLEFEVPPPGDVAPPINLKAEAREVVDLGSR